MVRRFVVLFALAVVPGLNAQTLPILSPEHLQLITQEISGDAAYEHIRFMTQFHRGGGGANGLWEAALYHERKAREYGLEDVQLIKQAYGRRPWNARFADLWIVEPVKERVASTLQTQLHLADFSRAAEVTAELIDVGEGSAASDYAGKDVSGKIVLTHGSVSTVISEAVWGRGALGVVWFPDPAIDQSISHPDQVRWSRVPVDGPQGQDSYFAFVLSVRQGQHLRTRLAQADEPFVVHAIVDAGFESVAGEEPWQVMVEAYIRGTEPGLAQDVVLTGHLQEEKFSANDDASGTSSILEGARALKKLIDEGNLPRPRRNLRFWWVTEISSQRQYFADNPQAHQQMWVNVNNDMVGVNQAQDVMRVQNITRLPASRFHFYNDVVEAIIDYLVTSNTSELAHGRAAGDPIYLKPHMAHLGTRHRYNASMIFFHNSTDHMTFNEAPIGVPGVTFTNWPDHYIHSSDDDLWNIDRTQLGRNSAATTLMAWTMAVADDDVTPALAAETVGRGAQRLARNLTMGLSWLATWADKDEAYNTATKQVRYAAARERMGLSSLQEIGDKGEAMVPSLLDALGERETKALSDLDLQYRMITGRRSARAAQQSSTERALADLRPVVTGGPGDFLEKRGDIESVSDLRSLMAFEVLNCVDGERTGLEIYEYVAAEAREAGDYYYGVVTPEAVLQYLQNVAETGLIELR
jgi:hypothetical protein